MKQPVAALCALGFLTACGDPLAGVDRISDVDLAETDPVANAVPDAQEIAREGYFSGLFGGVDARRAEGDVPPGTVLPYGTVARVCGARGAKLGKKVEKFPTRGRGYTLHDTFPNSTAPRTFYVTGFSDGCPRQFTASLALFGAPSMHEKLRYGRPGDAYPYSATDSAYEDIKRDVCGAAKRKPCGSRIKRLERNTVFISTYERFGGTSRWSDILLHDGEVMASAIKAQP
ncbi:hypothetical protein [Sulfitobacter sabulilitoris]|uniref:Uncharacterized protein n=1 Tax=Sulfitobacter sabulilitoris TaxID=2562655 RepID=A0A5S3PCH6_9RHOB|nr:hypothetical protein [Sulfitobacter sabulilitoris]TMM51557.1 hypothetical protein FDT80_12405 [Sulfitobacter sabulilitoris]